MQRLLSSRFQTLAWWVKFFLEILLSQCWWISRWPTCSRRCQSWLRKSELFNFVDCGPDCGTDTPQCDHHWCGGVSYHLTLKQVHLSDFQVCQLGDGKVQKNFDISSTGCFNTYIVTRAVFGFLRYYFCWSATADIHTGCFFSLYIWWVKQRMCLLLYDICSVCARWTLLHSSSTCPCVRQRRTTCNLGTVENNIASLKQALLGIRRRMEYNTIKAFLPRETN